MTSPYSLDVQPIQDDIVDYFESTYAGYSIFVDAFLDTEEAPRYVGGGVKPFIVLWFRGLRPSGRRKGTRSFAGPRRDAYSSGFDVVCVASNPTDARKLLNFVTDGVVGKKFDDTGLVEVDAALWENTRPILDTQNKSTRWAATQRFKFGVSQPRSA